MKKIAIISIILTMLLIATAPSSFAEVVTINIEAEISDFHDLGDAIFGGAINEGDYMWGQLTYETTTPDLDGSFMYGLYDLSNTPYGMTLHTGSFTFMTPSDGSFFIGINSYNNSMVYMGDGLPHSNGAPVDLLQWNILYETENTLLSDALPTTAPVLGDVGAGMDNIITIQGYVSPTMGYSLLVSPTSAVLAPEPISSTLFLVGGAALGFRRFRKKITN